uniref:Major facilitator superfamily (MFS) profile domain-containing protein n=1 Tax=Bicosoecida sp. CB-2014 TaxID=1486930 RepID=A0A7S1CJE9_9STRA
MPASASRDSDASAVAALRSGSTARRGSGHDGGAAGDLRAGARTAATDKHNGGRASPSPPQPFPWIKVAMCGLVLFANSLGLLMVFPIIPFMTRDFFPELDTHSLGYEAGYLGSAYHVGALVASLVWGRLSDVYGRRPIIIIGLVGSFVSILGFGLAQSFGGALFARFMWGALNGNLGVVKTLLSEVCDDSNRARGFAILGINGGLARIFGPAVGGFLADPASKWEAFDTPLWRQYKYLLPCVVVACLGFIALIGTWMWLEETRPASELRPLPLTLTPACLGRCGGRRRRRAAGYARVREDAGSGEDIERGVGAGSGSGSGSELSDDDAAAAAASVRGGASTATKSTATATARVTVWEVLTNKYIAITCGLYGLGAYIGIVGEEVFPLWLVNDPQHGGFAFEREQIALLFLFCGPAQLAFQVWVYPRVCEWLGIRGASGWAATVLALVFVALPSSSYVATLGAGVVWTVVVTLFSLSVIARVVMLTCVFVLISNASTKAQRGTAMGWGQTVCAFARIIGPAMGANLFAWSENNDLAWPFNYSLTFYLMGLLGVVYVYCVRSLPATIEASLAELEDSSVRDDDDDDDDVVVGGDGSDYDASIADFDGDHHDDDVAGGALSGSDDGGAGAASLEMVPLRA